MTSRLSGWLSATRASLPRALRQPRWRPAQALDLARRFAQFWVLWSFLLLVHEAGHAVTAARLGMTARRVTVGVGPAIARASWAGTEGVLRLVPIAGVTKVDEVRAASGAAAGWDEWGRQVAVLGGGVLATLALALTVAGAVAVRERTRGTRWVVGRILLADALVLSVFNLLPVPPLDGGRALVDAVVALRGAPLSKDALFWLQVGGLACAVVPMTLWTRWTRRIDAVAMRWGAPAGVRPEAPPGA